MMLPLAIISTIMVALPPIIFFVMAVYKSNVYNDNKSDYLDVIICLEIGFLLALCCILPIVTIWLLYRGL